MNSRIAINRITSVTLATVITVSSVVGCANTSGSNITNNESSSAVDTAEIAATITDALLDAADDSEAEPAPIEISTNWEDYAGNIDTFVYGLISNEYSQVYDVFNATIDLEDGSQIFGLGYTDYSCLLEEEGGKSYFPAGFISYIGEPEIPDSTSDEGLEVYNLDTADYISDIGYVLAYDTDPYMEHCVIWDQYLQYGIADDGSITYLCSDYERGTCDESLGALYSYDEGQYVYDPNVGDPIKLTGTSLYSLIDYDELEAEVNRILEEQDNNFSESDVESTIYIAQEALNAYMLAHLEETFMGYSVGELLEISETLDPKECLQFTDDGMVVVDMDSVPSEEPTELTKWIVGATCATAVVASVALTVFVPGSQSISGAVSGAAVEVFMEVLIQNQALSNVNWTKVGIAAASGAALAWACPALGSAAAEGTVKALGGAVMEESTLKILGKVAGYGVQTFSSALISGATGAAYTYLDGGTSDEAKTAFVTGAALAVAFTLGTAAISTAVGAAVGAGMRALENSAPNNWLTKATTATGQFIKNHQHPITRNESLQAILAPKSVCQATETALQEVNANEEIFASRMRQMVSDKNANLIKVDSTGKELTKKEIIKNGGNCTYKLREDCSPEMRQLFEENGITEIRVTEGIPDFDGASIYKFKPSKDIGPNRNVNYDTYFTDLAETWKDTSADVPDEILQYMSDQNISRENLAASKIEDILSDLNLTPHEGTDGLVYLVGTELHSKVSHAGGVAQAAIWESIVVGTQHFHDLIPAPVAGVFGTLMADTAEAVAQ